MSFFGLATLSAHGMFDYAGQFDVGLSGDLLLGTHDFGIEGTFSINASLYYDTSNNIHFDLNGSASVTARLFGINFASLGVSFDAQIVTDGGSVDISLSVTVHIHVIFFTISLTAHFDIGVVQFPKPYYLAGDANSNTAWDPTVNNGTLYLNTGTRASSRNMGPSSDTSTALGPNPTEAYIITDEGGSAASGETIQVTAFGHSQTFNGVKRIVDNAADPASVNNESLIVQPGVQVPVVFIGGPNSNTFDDNGSGYAVAYGGGANNSSTNIEENVLQAGSTVPGAILIGGPAYNDISNLSSSPSVLVGGAGDNQITGGPGNDIILGHAALVATPSDTTFQSFNASANVWTLPAFAITAGSSAGAWVLSPSNVQFQDSPYVAAFNSTPASPGSDTISGGNGNDFVNAGNGTNAVSWPVQPINMSNTFLAGQGGSYLYVEGASTPNSLSVSQVASNTFQVGVLSSNNGPMVGYLNAKGFANLELDGGASANSFAIGDLGGTGLQNVTINAGQNIVPTGQINTVNDPNNPGKQIQVPVVIVHPHSGADSITILGTNPGNGSTGNDTFTLAEDNANQAGQMTQVLVTALDGLGDTVNYTIINSVASQGDTLTINSLNGNDVVNAGGMGSTSAPANFPQLINLVEQVGSGTDAIITSPSFNDAVHLGTGSDTVTGGTGPETFVRDPNAIGIDTLIENHNLDFGLYNDKLVIGQVQQDGGGQSFSSYEYTQYLTEQQLITQFGQRTPNFPLNGVGNYFSSGSVVEPIGNLFAVVNLTGGNGTGTMVVGSPTNTIYVGGTSQTVVPFAGSATLNIGPNTSGGVGYYVVNIADSSTAHVAVADTGGTAGQKFLMVNGSSQADNLTLNASGSGAFRVGTIAESVVSKEFITFNGVQRLVLDTLGGNDNVLVNDTAAPTVVNFGNGNDNVVVGTVPLIPDKGNRTLEYPNGVPVVNPNGMTNGNSDDLFLMGGAGNDTFEVDHRSRDALPARRVGDQPVHPQHVPGAAEQPVRPQSDHQPQHDLRRFGQQSI